MGNRPSGAGGMKAIAPPCRDKQSEQGRRRPATMQSRRGNSGRDGSNDGFS